MRYLLRRCTAGLTAAALAFAQLALPTRAEAAGAGPSTASAGSAPPPSISTIQSFQPDLFTGRATTSIPLAVPPGRKGLQPSLALGYSSSARNGWVGVGWSLELGAIERSTKAGVPKYNSSDIFTLSFQGIASDLVKIPDGTYRAKDEGLFLRIEDKGVSGWEVRDKAGTRYLFGQTVASQVDSPSGQTFRWALDKIIDVNGNSLTIIYTKDQVYRQLYPSQILYTEHEPSVLAAANQVLFTLEDRPDDETSDRSGFAITTAKRLKSVEMKATVGGSLERARRYDLAYLESARTGRSLLDRVTVVGADGTTMLPATTFSYQAAAAPTYALQTNSTSVSSPIWNVRAANQDTGHENNLPCNPYLNVPWSQPVTQASGNIGAVSFSSGSNGSFTVSFPQDHFFHAWTWVYNSSSSSISIPTFAADAGCMWIEDSAGFRQGPSSGSVQLGAGWTVVHLTGYHQHESRTMTYNFGLKDAVSVMSPAQFIKPQLTGDVDGNGTSDLVIFDATTGKWTVMRGQTYGFSTSETWLPSGFGDATFAPLVGDWDADGLTDIAIYKNSVWRFARSTGSSFVVDAWPAKTFGSGAPVVGDFNGDGNLDIGTYNNGNWQIALGANGTFTTSSGLEASLGSASHDPLTGDFNGDGLTDIGIVSQTNGGIAIFFSLGTTWSSMVNWISDFGTGQPHTSADFNGDGLSDVAYYNRSTGAVVYAPTVGAGPGAPQTLPPTFSLRSTDDQLQIADINGDGLADPAVFNQINGASELARSQGTIADLLTTVNNGLGGSTSLSYQSSSAVMSSLLPFVIPLVSSASVSDGMGNTVTTTYSYSGGFYDAPTKEFRGFARAEVRDAAATVAITEFHQGLQTKGRPFRTEVRDAMNALWTKTEQTWASTEPYPGVFFTALSQTDSFIYDGNATSKQTRTRLTYDAYGNVTRADEDGDLAVPGDERSTVTTYALNPSPTAWILGTPSLVQTLDATGAVVAQRRFYYDNATDIATPPTLGRLTKEEEWRNLPSVSWPATTLTYDTYGNVLTVTDAFGPPGRTTTNTYDTATKTYLTQIQNHLGHTRQLAYDPRFGQVTSSTDQNGQTTTTEYDTLGRVTKIYGPLDNATYPTVSYTYALGSPISKTTVCTRVQSGPTTPICASTFTDGAGRTIQTRSPAENPAKQVVSGAVQLNSRGLATKQWVPYLSNNSENYVAPATEPGFANLASVSYAYDPLGRTLTVTDPDGAVTATAYDDGVVTVTDANSHQTRRTSDAYGRLSKVEEINGLDTYTTTYAYDTPGNLTQVTDHAGHITQISYDSLGRKLGMTDPDMGAWSYGYDAVDNLTSQTDARGVVTTFAYDALNRLSQKTYTVPGGSGIANPGTVTYTYDGADDANKLYAKGKLTRVADGSGTSSFNYDQLGRLITESKTLDSATYTIQRAYDLLGRLTTLTYPDNDVAAYTYNAQGGIESIVLTSASTGQQSIVSNVDYNAAGQLTKLALGNGLTTDYEYDLQTLRLDTMRTKTAGLQTLQDFKYEFDPVGNVSQITDYIHTASQTFQYDPLNRLTQASGAYGTVTYAYDPLGNLTQKEGATLTYGLAGGAKPHAVTAATGLPSGVSSLAYDANGNLTQKTLSVSSLLSQSFSYDAENRLIEVKSPQTDTVSVTFQPGWNFFSLPVIPDNASVATLLPNFTQNFEQLVRVDGPGVYSHYVGDAVFDDFTTLQYGKGYQIYCKAASAVTVSFTGKLPSQSLTQPLGAGWQLVPSITIDGALTVGQVLNGLSSTQRLRYDTASSSLASVATGVAATPGNAYFVQVTSGTWAPPLPKNPTTTAVYDGDGGRVKQITAAGTTKFLGQSYEIAPDGKRTKYVFAGSQRLAAIDTPAGQASLPQTQQSPTRLAKLWRGLCDLLDVPSAEAAVPPAQIHFYHTDHLGSTNLVTDGTGQVVELAEHTPFGSLSRHEGPANRPQKFTGQRLDASTGLYFYNARYYDPDLGRFTQPDPFVQEPADPQSLNRYTYCRNNPVAYVDPSGYFSLKRFFKAMIYATIAAVAIIVGIVAASVGAEPVAAWAFSIAIWAGTMYVTNLIGAFHEPSNIKQNSPQAREAAGENSGFSLQKPFGIAETRAAGAPLLVGLTATAVAGAEGAALASALIPTLLLVGGALVLRQWYEGIEVVGYHATTVEAAKAIMGKQPTGFRMELSDLSGTNRFAAGYYLGASPAEADKEFGERYGHRAPAMIRVTARLRKSLLVVGPLGERPLSRWIGTLMRAAGGSIVYAAELLSPSPRLDYVLFDPQRQVVSQQQTR